MTSGRLAARPAPPGPAGITARSATSTRLTPIGSVLHRHRSPLVSPADPCGLLAVAGDDAHALVELGGNILRRAGLEKRHAVFPAGGEDALARLSHFRRIRVARHRQIAERQSQIAGSQFGKAEARHGEDFLAMGDPLRALELDAEQQLAIRVERPRIAVAQVRLPRNPPHWSGGRFRAATARADPEPAVARLGGRAAHPFAWRGE